VIETSQPAAEPITLAMAKNHLRVDFDEDDQLIEAWMTAARQYVEKVTRRPIFNRTVVLTLDQFPMRESSSLNPRELHSWSGDLWERFSIRLPRPRCQSITSITYQDNAGDVLNLDPSQYRADLSSEPARIVPAPSGNWPYLASYVPGSIKVTYIAGNYGDGAETNTCPQTLVAAILLLVGHWYQNREAVSQTAMTQVPIAVEALLNTEKSFNFFGYE
jgi:uncharacterized phiE125 gp8 family phage protein